MILLLFFCKYCEYGECFLCLSNFQFMVNEQQQQDMYSINHGVFTSAQKALDLFQRLENISIQHSIILMKI